MKKQQTIKEKLRMVFRFLDSKVGGWDEHGNNGYVILSGKKWFVGKMSYDMWFLEPYKKDRTERDDFGTNALMENSDTLEIIQLFEDNNLLELVIN